MAPAIPGLQETYSFMQQQTRQVRQRQQQDDRRHQAWLNHFYARMARIAPEETRKAA